MGVLATVHATALDLLGDLQRDAALAQVDEGNNEGQDDQHSQDREGAQEGSHSASIAEAGDDTIEQVGHNTGEDQQGDTIADALVGNALTDPHGQGSTASHGDADEDVVPQTVLGVAQTIGQTNSLNHSQSDGDVAGDTIDLLAATFFLLHALQNRKRDAQELHDNRSVDVGGDTHGHNGHLGHRATGHHVHDIKQGQVIAAHAQSGQVDTGSRDTTHQTEQDQHTKGIEDLLAQVFDLPQLADVLKHVRSPRRCRQRLRSSPSQKR